MKLKKFTALFLKHRMAVICLVFIAIVILCGIFAESVAPNDPVNVDLALKFQPPSMRFPFGTDNLGRCVFSRIIYGIRISLGATFVVMAASLIIGTVIGVYSGYKGGRTDMVLMRLADVLLAVPAIMILILAAALFRPSPDVLALLLAGFMWPTISKGIRAQTLTVKESLHIRAARQMGGGGGYILRRHLIPEMFPLYLIGFAAKARMAMFMEASLAFLGLFDPTRKSLGMMISYALKYYYMDIWWHWIFPPILCLSLLIITVTFLAISMEKVLDPRLREALVERTA